MEQGKALSLDQCVQTALDNLPALRAARATADADRSLIRQAQAAYYPQVDWNSAVSRSYIGPKTTLGVKSNSVTSNSYSTGLGLSQNIFDFGRTPAQVRIQKLTYGASVSDIETATEQAVFAVKQSYYAVLQAKRDKDVAEEAVRQYELHLEQARGLVEVGLQPKYDVTKATVDLGNAKVNLIKARNAVKLALTGLNNAMGVTGGVDYDVEDNMSFEAYGISLEEALTEAYKNRPELAALTARRQAAESSVSLAKAGYYPALAGSASFSYAGNSFPLANGWSLALSLNVPVFNGFRTAGEVAQARAGLEVLRADEATLRLSVYLSVQQAYLNLKQAEEVVPVAELNVTAARENFDIATGSYKEGVGDPIQVADASAALVAARIAYNQALYDCKVARANLDLAMGMKRT